LGERGRFAKVSIYALTNISSTHVSVSLPKDSGDFDMKDLLSGKIFKADSIGLNSYQFAWLITQK